MGLAPFEKKNRFPKQRNSKLNPCGDGPFQILKKINNNAYQLDLPNDYCKLHTTFNVTDLLPFTGSTDDKENDLDLRTNPVQEGEDDGRRSKQCPIARVMARHIEEQGESEAPVELKMLTNLIPC